MRHSDNVAYLMAAADVVVTSPGQACHEARAAGRPLVIMDTVPGHGRENVLAELSKGGALVTTLAPEQIEEAVLVALEGSPNVQVPPTPGVWAKQFLESLG
ncbi:MAG: hypothetical protein ACRDVP_10635 [Acidimicrobiales bacterium]